MPVHQGVTAPLAVRGEKTAPMPVHQGVTAPLAVRGGKTAPMPVHQGVTAAPPLHLLKPLPPRAASARPPPPPPAEARHFPLRCLACPLCGHAACP